MDTNKPMRKRANTRQRLLDAAVDVFIAKGFAGTRIDDVVKKAGFTRGAFYSNYSSLDELLQEALVNRKERFMKELGERIAAVPPLYGIGAMIQVLESLRPAGRTLYIFHTEVLLYRMSNPESAAFANVIMTHIHEELGEIISLALTQLGRRPTIEVVNIAELLSSIFFDSLAREQAGLTPDDQKHILADLIEAVVYRFSEPIGRVEGHCHGGAGPDQGAERCDGGEVSADEGVAPSRADEGARSVEGEVSAGVVDDKVTGGEAAEVRGVGAPTAGGECDRADDHAPSEEG